MGKVMDLEDVFVILGLILLMELVESTVVIF
jgi:hypothetical protein